MCCEKPDTPILSNWYEQNYVSSSNFYIFIPSVVKQRCYFKLRRKNSVLCLLHGSFFPVMLMGEVQSSVVSTRG